ncbi:MAG: 4Fe-4S dicluster domain-containing protein [Candidatus Omnitrophica bacterium]|nr:4Fe-4S dicluster domain-containing protein [Candidatus Omnitrophota bacterium]MBU1924235.1 4Fe-4S dicluster domain-containing protein [Candidatus Omnitrophota bacterium]
MHQIYYIESNQLNILSRKLKKDYRVFFPVTEEKNATKKTDYSYRELTVNEPFVFNPYRTVEPLKTFFTPPLDKAAEYFNQEGSIEDFPKIIIFGVKSCDIVGHKVQDFVFLEGVEVDSLYRLRRENIIFISSDCTDFKEVCHCLAWEILPYPTEGFDLNLSPLNEGYLVETGSKKGEELIQQYKEFFVIAKDTQLTARKVKRENLIERLKKHLLPQHLVSKDIVQRLIKEGYNLDTWQQFMLTCVECGGCNFICDTCHCFLLMDKKEGNINKKLKAWDACLYTNYAKVAGGANPLKTRTRRLRFRFTKKFDFFVDNLGMPACCGCGRCIEVCPGKIDIREVLKDLAKKLSVKT